jgi:hypothetical protein
VLSDPSDQGSIWKGDAWVGHPYSLHHCNDEGNKIDESLCQKSVEAASSLNGNRGEAHYWEDSVDHDVVDAPVIILEGANLKGFFSFHFHLLGTTVGKALDYLGVNRGVVEWPWKAKVMYSWCPGDTIDEGGSYQDRFRLS